MTSEEVKQPRKWALGMSTPELLFAVLGTVAAPISAGIWVGMVQHDTNTNTRDVVALEERVQKVETTPVDVAVLTARIDNMADELGHVRDDLKTMISKQDQMIGKLEARSE